MPQTLRERAPADRRALLWRCSYKRWRRWAFNKGNPNQNLTSIVRSELDYAIVAYAGECMTDAERIDACQLIRLQMFALHREWHASYTGLLGNWNRLLSEFQPYAHERAAAATGEDWLCDAQKNYWPFDQSQERYLMMKY